MESSQKEDYDCGVKYWQFADFTVRKKKSFCVSKGGTMAQQIYSELQVTLSFAHRHAEDQK